jgi:hypothetical protein
MIKFKKENYINKLGIVIFEFKDSVEFDDYTNKIIIHAYSDFVDLQGIPYFKDLEEAKKSLKSNYRVYRYYNNEVANFKIGKYGIILDCYHSKKYGNLFKIFSHNEIGWIKEKNILLIDEVYKRYKIITCICNE